MKVAIIGAGHIGGNVARRLIAGGHHVRLASRDPRSLTALVASLGETAGEGALPAVVAWGEAVWLAVPWAERTTIFAAAGGPAAFAGKIVVDTLNPFVGFAVEPQECPSSVLVAAALGRDAKVVKALNTIRFERIADAARAAGAIDRIAVPIAGDDAGAKAVVIRLLDDMGFDALDAGSLAGSRRQEPDQPLFDKLMTRAALSRALAA